MLEALTPLTGVGTLLEEKVLILPPRPDLGVGGGVGPSDQSSEAANEEAVHVAPEDVDRSIGGNNGHG